MYSKYQYMSILNISTSVAIPNETLIIHITFQNCHTRPYVKPFMTIVALYHGTSSWHPACAVTLILIWDCWFVWNFRTMKLKNVLSFRIPQTSYNIQAFKLHFGHTLYLFPNVMIHFRGTKYHSIVIFRTFAINRSIASWSE